MRKDEFNKKGDGIDVYLMFLMPFILTVLLIFATSIGKEKQLYGEWQAESGIFLKESIRPLMLSDELPFEYTLKKLHRKKLIYLWTGRILLAERRFLILKKY